MIVTPLEFETLRVYATLTKQLNRYVILKKDDEGYYIEYAFIEGAPHDNRCLDWYSSYQENAYIRNKWLTVRDKNGNEVDLPEDEKVARLAAIKAKIDAKVGQIFLLQSFTCGYEEYEEASVEEKRKTWEKFHRDEFGNLTEPFVPEDHVCKVGHPAKACGYCSRYWAYNEPVKCACWSPSEIQGLPKTVSIPMEQAMELREFLIKDQATK